MIEVATLADLQAIKNDLGGRYRLVADIDASETKNWDNGNGFKPLGSKENRFAGIFDGNGHTICSLYVARSQGDNIGLFGALDRTAEVRNLQLKNIIVLGNRVVGGLAGCNDGIIFNCQISGKVSGSEYIGGLAGANYNNVTGCQVYGKVSADKGLVGGLVGISKPNPAASCWSE
jgi:hypothetical protein